MKGFATSISRSIKAKKIDAILKDAIKKDALADQTILDIGCGSGIITAYFAEDNKVFGIDAENQLASGYDNLINFTLVSSASIPFENDMFDIVLTNHVIEHVENQQLHLREIFRVLKPGAVCYCATPNWYFPIEPHYRIPLIHYLPRPLFHGILRMFGLYKENLFLLSHSEMIRLFRSEGFDVTEYTGKILKDPNRFHLGFRFTKFIPSFILSLLTPFVPTNIFILKKRR